MKDKTKVFFESTFVLLMLMSMTFLSGIATFYLSVSSGVAYPELVVYVIGVSSYLGLVSGIIQKNYVKNLKKVEGVEF